MGIKLHFESDFDVIKSEGRVPHINWPNLEKNGSRKSMIFRLAKRFDLPFQVVEYCIAQYIKGQPEAIFNSMAGEENYQDFLKYKIASTQICINELQNQNIPELIQGFPPKIFREVLKHTIFIQTASILNTLIPYIDIKRDYFGFRETANIIVKLGPFIKYDKQRVISTLNLSAKYNVGNAMNSIILAT